MLQSTIARSHAALPLVTIYTLALWGIAISHNVMLWPCLAIFLVSSYLMVELNNRNALMHTYSRMVSCSFMMLTMTCTPLTTEPQVMTVQLCIIISLTLFFLTYQDKESVGTSFFAYLMIGIASLLWMPVIFFLPFLWIAQANFMMSFSWRALMASVFGILTPYWIAVPVWMFFIQQHTAPITPNPLDLFISNFTPNEKVMTLFTDPAQILQSPSLPILSPLGRIGGALLLGAALMVSIMLITGIIHYFRNFQKDKIKVSMIYQFLLILALPTLLAMIIAIPIPFDTAIHLHMLLAILIVMTAPFIAHYITLTSTRLTNISVIVMIIIVIAITAINNIPKELLPLTL